MRDVLAGERTKSKTLVNNALPLNPELEKDSGCPESNQPEFRGPCGCMIFKAECNRLSKHRSVTISYML